MLSIFLNQKMRHKNTKRDTSHVGNRILKKVHSIGSCVYSKHDSSWVDFLRLTHSVDPITIEHVSKSYWGGINVEDCQLSSMGKSWTQSPIIEILFLGRIEFYDKNININCREN